MKVVVGKRMYSMTEKEYTGLRNIAKEQVPMGIYAIERKGIVELRCDMCESMSRLKNMINQFKSQGYTVHANK